MKTGPFQFVKIWALNKSQPTNLLHGLKVLVWYMNEQRHLTTITITQKDT